ncbi:MAG: thermonuclease family protein [Candidatus Caldarchaeum sp.]|nr:thermonuclease family protein [Candidatus Caldarchaeum sp.]MDW8434787.1 thermonuclease family protein [Candidatus Caldarchaeum sp.]
MRFSVAAALALFVIGFLTGYLIDGGTSTSTVVSTVTVRQTTTAVKTTTVAATVTTTAVTTARNPVIAGKTVDMVARVYRVVDGDTFDAFPSGRVRLADVNTPERGEPGYTEATNALRSVVEGKTVYLDVDDTAVMDAYNRLVALVYVDFNATHVLNVNLWLVLNNHARINDFRNEFNPATWTLYAKKN